MAKGFVMILVCTFTSLVSASNVERACLSDGSACRSSSIVVPDDETYLIQKSLAVGKSDGSDDDDYAKLKAEVEQKRRLLRAAEEKLDRIFQKGVGDPDKDAKNKTPLTDAQKKDAARVSLENHMEELKKANAFARQDEIDDIKDKYADKLTGCENGGDVCSDASTVPPDPFDLSKKSKQTSLLSYSLADEKLTSLHLRLEQERVEYGWDGKGFSPGEWGKLLVIKDKYGNTLKAKDTSLLEFRTWGNHTDEQQYPLSVTLLADCKSKDVLSIPEMLKCQLEHSKEILAKFAKQAITEKIEKEKAGEVWVKEGKDLVSGYNQAIKDADKTYEEKHLEIAAKYKCAGDYWFYSSCTYEAIQKSDDLSKPANDAVSNALHSAKEAAKDVQRQKKEEQLKHWKDAEARYKKFTETRKKVQYTNFSLPYLIQLVERSLAPTNHADKADVSFGVRYNASTSKDLKVQAAILAGMGDDYELKKYYLTKKVKDMVEPNIKSAFYEMTNTILGEGGLLYTAKEACTKFLVPMLGSIPFVGGFLAAIGALIVDTLFRKVIGIFTGLLRRKLLYPLISATVTSLVDSVLDPEKQFSGATKDIDAVLQKAIEGAEHLTVAKSAEMDNDIQSNIDKGGKQDEAEIRADLKKGAEKEAESEKDDVEADLKMSIDVANTE